MIENNVQGHDMKVWNNSLKIEQALRVIRRELTIKDEPFKMHKLFEMFSYVSGLDEERHKTARMVRHMFDPDELKRCYDIPIPDCEFIEPKEFILNAGPRYPRYQWVLNHLQKDGAKSFIDLGCYVGSLVTTAAKMGVEGYGVDFTQQAIDTAQNRALEGEVADKCHFFVGDVTTWSGAKADAVNSMEVIEHVVDPGAYIQHLLSLCNPGGHCYVSTPDGPFGNGDGNLSQGWDLRDDKDYRGHVRVFTSKTLTKLIEEMGGEVVELGDLRDGLVSVKFKAKEN